MVKVLRRTQKPDPDCQVEFESHRTGIALAARPVQAAAGTSNASAVRGASPDYAPAAVAAQPPSPDTQPPVNVPPVGIAPGQPGSNLSDLSLPAAERGTGGGEPTTSATAAEETKAAEAKVDARGLLMKAFDVPEDAKWRVFGWIQNSFTGNGDGYHSGINFGDNPNSKPNQWMGNQYYLILERPLKQEDKVTWGMRIDNLFGNDWQFNYMQGFLNRVFKPGSFTGYDMAQFFGEVHFPVFTPGRLRCPVRPLVHSCRL